MPMSKWVKHFFKLFRINGNAVLVDWQSPRPPNKPIWGKLSPNFFIHSVFSFGKITLHKMRAPWTKKWGKASFQLVWGVNKWVHDFDISKTSRIKLSYMVKEPRWLVSHFIVTSYTFNCVKMSDFAPNNRYLQGVLLFLFNSKKMAAEAYQEPEYHSGSRCWKLSRHRWSVLLFQFRKSIANVLQRVREICDQLKQ